MPDVQTVTRIAREKMGALSRGATGEFGMLARLLRPDEAIEAIAVGKLRDAGWFGATRLVVATPERLLLVSKAMITRREQVREIPLAHVRSARAAPPGLLELELDEELLRLSWMGPPAQLAALAAAARGTPARFEELRDLARRKLGDVLSFAVEGSLLALGEELGPDEAVVDLASWTGRPGGIVAACDARLVAIPDKGPASGRPISIRFDEIDDIREDGHDLVVRTRGGEHRFDGLVPAERAGVIATRVAARLT